MAAHLGKGFVMKTSRGWQYYLGPFLYVAVVTKQGQRERDVSLPKGRWIDYWNPGRVYDGKQKIKVRVPIDQYPLFVREGAVIPMNVRNDTTGHGGVFSRGKLTLDVYPPDEGGTTFRGFEEPDNSATVRVSREAGKLTVAIDRPYRDMFIRIGEHQAPPALRKCGIHKGFFYDPKTGAFYRDVPAADEPFSVTIE